MISPKMHQLVDFCNTPVSVVYESPAQATFHVLRDKDNDPEKIRNHSTHRVEAQLTEFQKSFLFSPKTTLQSRNTLMYNKCLLKTMQDPANESK